MNNRTWLGEGKVVFRTLKHGKPPSTEEKYNREERLYRPLI
jgi:hypothetical protein